MNSVLIFGDKKKVHVGCGKECASRIFLRDMTELNIEFYDFWRNFLINWNVITWLRIKQNVFNSSDLFQG